MSVCVCVVHASARSSVLRIVRCMARVVVWFALCVVCCVLCVCVCVCVFVCVCVCVLRGECGVSGAAC